MQEVHSLDVLFMQIASPGINQLMVNWNFECKLNYPNFLFGVNGCVGGVGGVRWGRGYSPKWTIWTAHGSNKLRTPLPPGFELKSWVCSITHIKAHVEPLSLWAGMNILRQRGGQGHDWYCPGLWGHQVIIRDYINRLRPRQNGRHFADDIFKCILLNENVWIPNKISLKFVPKGLINNIPSLVQIMAWRRPGDKPLSEPMMVSSLTRICVTRPQWVKT